MLDYKVISVNKMSTRITLRLLKIEEIISRVANIKIEEIRGRSRDREVADARAVIWFIAFTYFRYSYSYIGRIYGRDHTSISSAVKRIRKSDIDSKIVDGIKAIDPHILEPRKEYGEPISIENWQFKNSG